MDPLIKTCIENERANNCIDAIFYTHVESSSRGNYRLPANHAEPTSDTKTIKFNICEINGGLADTINFSNNLS